jgi:hypothetical protein
MWPGFVAMKKGRGGVDLVESEGSGPLRTRVANLLLSLSPGRRTSWDNYGSLAVHGMRQISKVEQRREATRRACRSLLEQMAAGQIEIYLGWRSAKVKSNRSTQG